MSKTVLFIDGENFKGYYKFFFEDRKIFRNGKWVAEDRAVMRNGERIKFKRADLATIDYEHLFYVAFKGFEIDEMRWYAGRLTTDKRTPKQSQALQDMQLELSRRVTDHGMEFIKAGNVRGQEVIGKDGKSTIVFKEKGVDVKIAVDTVAGACDGTLKRAIILSSDSDMQPAVMEMKKRGVEVYYVAFSYSPNKGLTQTCKPIFLSDRLLKEAYIRGKDQEEARLAEDKEQAA